MKKIIELIKYSIYGVITTSINLFLFFGLTYFGVYYIIANIISYIISVLINYKLNEKFVFLSIENLKSDKKKAFIRFIILRMASLILDSVLFFIIVNIMKMNIYLSRILLSIGIIIITYYINSKFVFRKEEIRT